jgi:hypothetical protein
VQRPALGVFLILWLSYAFFWHGRDWNTASRLMLTYALVDRGSVSIDGLDRQTGDKAIYLQHYYSDKLPGFSFAGTLPYLAYRSATGAPAHPLNVDGFAHWPADYWVTLFTSGLATAMAGAILTRLSLAIGCGPRRAVLVGLAYGLATPAYAYATLAYGHQLAAAMLLGSFALIWQPSAGRGRGRSVLAGFLASYASVIELQVGPISAILGFYAIALAIGKQRSWESVILFGLGALGPALFLLGYDWVAFDSPLRMGYFFHATKEFARVHSAANPLGLRAPDWSRVDDLLILPARGLFWYAPVLLLTPLGLVALVFRKYRGMAVVVTATIVAVFMVNLSYPEWSGGWSTGPRLLVPLLPFAMLGVAGLLASGNAVPSSPQDATKNPRTIAAATLGLAGFVVITLFQGIGARVPDPVRDAPAGYHDSLAHPLANAVWPIWRGDDLPDWDFGQRFSRTIFDLFARQGISDSSATGRQWRKFLPLWVGQALAITLLFLTVRPTPVKPTGPDRPPVERPMPARPDPA